MSYSLVIPLLACPGTCRDWKPAKVCSRVIRSTSVSASFRTLAKIWSLLLIISSAERTIAGVRKSQTTINHWKIILSIFSVPIKVIQFSDLARVIARKSVGDQLSLSFSPSLYISLFISLSLSLSLSLSFYLALSRSLFLSHYNKQTNKQKTKHTPTPTHTHNIQACTHANNFFVKLYKANGK